MNKKAETWAKAVRYFQLWICFLPNLSVLNDKGKAMYNAYMLVLKKLVAHKTFCSFGYNFQLDQMEGGHSALHVACHEGHCDVIRELIDRGADRDKQV